MALVNAIVQKTESEEKVRKAILNIFPDARLRFDGEKLSGDCDLANFFTLASRQHISDSLLSAIRKNASNGNSFIELNKTAALAGLLGRDEGSPLGAIQVAAPLAEFEAGLISKPV
ncbi:hypothetical protein HY546_01175 [archaeon]|nr:hypothetical protein [archaeon]